VPKPEGLPQLCLNLLVDPAGWPDTSDHSAG